MAEQKYMKKRISLRDVFRSTPKARKDYIKGVDKFNLELKQAKAEKIKQQKELDEYNRQMAQAFKKARSGGGHSVIYVKSVKEKEEIKEKPKLSSSGTYIDSSGRGYSSRFPPETKSKTSENIFRGSAPSFLSSSSKKKTINPFTGK